MTSELESLRELVLECVDNIRKLQMEIDILKYKNIEQDGYIHWRLQQ